MEEVKRINAVMAIPQQRVGFPQRNSYAMNIDRKKNRNCYSYGGFGYIVRNCRNRGLGMNRRMETEDNNNSLNGNRGLMGPN